MGVSPWCSAGAAGMAWEVEWFGRWHPRCISHPDLDLLKARSLSCLLAQVFAAQPRASPPAPAPAKRRTGVSFLIPINPHNAGKGDRGLHPKPPSASWYQLPCVEGDSVPQE